MFHISRVQSAAFLQWAETFCTGPEEDRKTIAFQTLRPVVGKAAFLSRTIKGIMRVKNLFWKQVLETWATFNKHSGSQDFMYPTILNNKYPTYQSETLLNEICIKI